MVATKQDLFLIVTVETGTFVALVVGVAVRLATQRWAALALQLFCNGHTHTQGIVQVRSKRSSMQGYKIFRG